MMTVHMLLPLIAMGVYLAWITWRLEQTIRTLKTIAEQLMLANTRFRKIFETAMAAIVIADSDGTITDWNPSAVRIFGYSHEEAVGRKIEILMPERYRQAHRDGLSRVQKKGLGSSKLIGKFLELQGVRSNGEEFPLRLALNGWYENGGIAFCGILRDMTE